LWFFVHEEEILLLIVTGAWDRFKFIMLEEPNDE